MSPLLQHDPAEAQPGACEPRVYGEHENEDQSEPSWQQKSSMKILLFVVLCRSPNFERDL